MENVIQKAFRAALLAFRTCACAKTLTYTFILNDVLDKLFVCVFNINSS